LVNASGPDIPTPFSMISSPDYYGPLKFARCDFVDGATHVAYRGNANCSADNVNVCFAVLGYGDVSIGGNDPNQMAQFVGTEGEQFDNTVTKLTLRLFDFTSASDTAAFCDRNAQSAQGVASSQPFNASDATQFESPENFFRGIKSTVCLKYFDAAAFTCNYNINENVIDFILRVSSYLLFVQLVVWLIVIKFKHYYAFHMEKKLEDEEEDEEKQPPPHNSGEFQSARVETHNE